MRKMYMLICIGFFAVLAQSRADSLQDFTRDLERSPVPVTGKRTIEPLAFLDLQGNIMGLSALDVPEAIAPDTMKHLAPLIENKLCTMYITRANKAGRSNRMGQTLGHFECGPDKTWLQGDLLANGLARVRTTPENTELSATMLKIEDDARHKKIGLWGKPELAVLTPDTAGQHINSFQLVEGTIYAVAQTNDIMYLNFARDWKTDFTIGIPNKLRRDFAVAHINLQSLKGAHVRVRGWLRDYNGPYIELDHIQQLEILTTANQPTAEQPHEDNGAIGMHTIGGPKLPQVIAPTVAQPTAPKAAPTKEKPTKDIIDGLFNK